MEPLILPSNRKNDDGTGWTVLKRVLIVFAVLDLITGVLYFFIANSANNIDPRLLSFMEGVSEMHPWIIIAICFIGGLALITGMLGLIGFIKKRRSPAIGFLVFNLIFVFMFGGIFAATIYGQDFQTQNLPEQSCASSILANYNQMTYQVKLSWCQVSLDNSSFSDIPGCPCSLDDTSIWSQVDQEQLNNPLRFSNITPKGTNNILQCKAFTNRFDFDSNVSDFLQAAEESLKCTGVCQGSIIYAFTNINNGPPEHKNGCYNQVRQLISNWLQLLHAISISSAVVCLLSLVFSNILFKKTRLIFHFYR